MASFCFARFAATLLVRAFAMLAPSSAAAHKNDNKEYEKGDDDNALEHGTSIPLRLAVSEERQGIDRPRRGIHAEVKVRRRAFCIARFPHVTENRAR